ncbi:unnamed protein product [Prunus armeniaca]
MFCPDMPSAQGVQINIVDIEVAEELVADETVAEEDDAKKGATDEVAANFAEQIANLGGAMKGAVDHAKVEEVIEQ